MWFDEELLDDLDNEIEEEVMLNKYIYKVTGVFPIIATNKADADEKINDWLSKWKPKYVENVSYAYTLTMKGGKFTKPPAHLKEEEYTQWIEEE